MSLLLAQNSFLKLVLHRSALLSIGFSATVCEGNSVIHTAEVG
jgi:hypothetical protein